MAMEKEELLPIKLKMARIFCLIILFLLFCAWARPFGLFRWEHPYSHGYKELEQNTVLMKKGS